MNGPSITLKNNRLEVEINRPGSLYYGSRFDWTGWIQKVTLDGKHSFASSESLNPGEGTGGSGMCNEFGMNQPVGYDDCPSGEQFPKIGVGLLTRPDEKAYDFFRDYAKVPFPVEIQQTNDSVSFQLNSLPCRGYEVTLRKTLCIEENRLDMNYELHNVGSKVIDTEEYNHNFVIINGNTVGPEYSLSLPFETGRLDALPEIWRGEPEGNVLRWNHEPDHVFYFKYSDCVAAQQNSWTLIHEPSGVRMQETLYAHLHRFALWGKKHVVSPEMFVKISLKPGEKMKWTRSYTFSSDRT